METHRLALPSGYRIENYEIQGVLGKGGFGITYVAYDWTLGRHMAIKELLPDSIATRIEGSTVVAMGPSLASSDCGAPLTGGDTSSWTLKTKIDLNGHCTIIYTSKHRS